MTRSVVSSVSTVFCVQNIEKMSEVDKESDQKLQNEMSPLEWIELQRTIDDYNQKDSETFFQKAKRKTLQNPIAPLGFIGACGFLIYGLKALNRGDSKTQQYMMRGRVISQAIGIGSIMIGLMMASKNSE